VRGGENSLLALYAAARALSENPPLAEVPGRILCALGSTLGWAFGEFWAAEPDGRTLRLAASWWPPESRAEAFEAAGREVAFGSGEGLIGRVALQKRPDWVPDVQADPFFVRADLARAAGFRSALAFPVQAGDRVVGVIAFFVREVIAPDEGLRDLMAQAGNLVGEFMGRRRAEQDLEAERGRFRRLYDSGVIGIILADTLGRITDANDAYLQMVGYTREELARGELRWDKLTPPEYKAADERALVELRERGVVIPFEKAHLHKDGRPVPIQIGVALLPGSKTDCICYVQDLTPRKRLEEEFRHSQKMEAVGRLAGGIAHDFNNLLTVITGYGGLAQGQLGPDHPARGSLTEVEAACGRAAALTRQLLAISRKQVFSVRVLDPNALVTETSAMIGRLLGPSIELAVELDPAAGRIRADRGQMEQVILNLSINARDAMPQGGRLVLRTSNVVLEGNPVGFRGEPVKPGPYVLIGVRDTGTGMTAETLEHLFEPYFTTKDPGKGTGLGLSTVRGIIGQCGGSVDVFTEPGRGTEVLVYLPRLEAPLETEAARALVPHLGKANETVLVVDDSAIVRKLVSQILRSQGYQVFEAQDGREALKVAGGFEGRIHLLLTDVLMPEMNGAELARALRFLRPEAKCLFMSGYAADVLEGEGLISKEVHFLAKPFDPISLLRSVRETLGAM
jgi:PAS domain S-box-containing protein